MLTSIFFIAIMMVGVPIGLCLCLSGIFYIYNTENTVLLQSFPSQMFGGWTAMA
nr:hypothetical protein [Comamonas thiooxydans]